MKDGIEGIDYTKNAEGKYQVTNQWEAIIPAVFEQQLCLIALAPILFFTTGRTRQISTVISVYGTVQEISSGKYRHGITYYSETYKDKWVHLDTKFE